MRAAIYTRQSLDKSGAGLAVARQLADCEKLCAGRGWDIIARESDNDTSAYQRKKRPGYQRIIALMEGRAADVVVVWAVDRLSRRLADLLDLIDLCEKTGVRIATVSGDLDLSTDAGKLVARILGSVAQGEVERKGTRQKRANEAGAKAGNARKGSPLPFGWQADRITPDPGEHDAVLSACRALLAGGTVSGIMRDWDARGLRPHQAPFGPLPERAWTRTSVREILANPRNAGIAVYRKEKDGTGIARYNEVGRGEWEPLVTEEMYRAVTEILRDRKQRQPAPGGTTLLGGIALCRCGNRVTGSANASGSPAYRCNLQSRGGRPGPHVQVKRAEVDDTVGRLVVAHVSDPRNADRLLAPDPPGGDAAALRDEAAILRHKIARLGELYMDDKITEADLTGGRERGRARLAEIEARLAGLGRGSVLAPLITAPDPAAAWEKMSTDRRRATVDALMTVTLYPSGRGARTFDPETVLPTGRGIVWKQP